MQPTGTGAGTLSRFRSAPATWLEALLESEEEDVIIDQPKPTPPLPPQPPIPASSYLDPNLFLPSPITRRQNSSPAEFSQIVNSDGFFPDFAVPVTPNYDDYASKPSRNVGLEDQPVNFRSQLSEDQSALLDVEMDKMLEDSVLCKVRAKRGCATHPRSIAERVRRTRISDRIRKLQELVPNMDKQTNTSDMLEEAVEYVKFLQKQIQELREHRNKCTCSANE